ncbi:MAG: formamidopyrimidine-DNA glycosylase [Pseudomonadota bacterium]
MPELPEVQATVDYLRERVQGATIVRSNVSWARTVSPKDPLSFEQEICGARISSLFRRGKYVGMRLDAHKPLYLFTHLRMSGSLDVIPTDFELARHDRVCIELDSGKSIRFNDTRKFGRMTLCENPDDVIGHLGLEPLDPSCTPEALQGALSQKSGRIKPVLLDQTVIAGLGNIYVDEVLWKIKVHPLTRASTLGDDHIRKLHRAIRETLSEAIEKLGCDFGDGVVDGGMYKPRVYGRDEKKCSRCRDTIVRIVVAQRGTHVCPTCQVKPRARRASSSHKR